MSPTLDAQNDRKTIPITTRPKSLITCHVLDSALAKPAEGIVVGLQRYREISDDGGSFAFDPIAYGRTDEFGNCMDLLEPTTESSRELAILRKGIYKITFQTKSYFEATNRDCFYPWIEIPFEVNDNLKQHHIQLHISTHSFTTL